MAHLQELRSRLLWSFLAVVVGIGIAVVYADDALILILNSAKQGREVQLVATTLAETFMVQFRLAIYGGLVLASPVVLYQLLAFIVPGLHPNERRLLRIGLPASVLLFIGGWAFGWFVAVPVTKTLFFDISAGVGVTQFITPQNYLNFVLGLCNPLGLSFQTPLLVFIVARLGIVTARFLGRIRKYALLLLLVLAAVLSPPDVVSMTVFFVPLYGLYEISILVARFAAPKVKK